MGFFDKLFGPPGKDRFARMMAEAIREAGEAEPIAYDPDHFRLVARGEGSNILHLDNAYREYCAAPKGQRQEVLRRFVRTWFSHHKKPPSDFEDVAPDLLPGVRGRFYFEQLRLRAPVEGGGKPDWPYQVVGEHLGAGLVYDLPDSMMQIQGHQLADWGITFDEAFEVARKNLLEMSQDSLAPLAPGVWGSPWRDNYDASRLILHDLIRRHEVRGDHIAMVPNRDTLAVTGSEDEAGLAHLASLAEEAREKPRPLSGIAFRLEGDSWAPYLPAPGHPQHGRFRSLWIKTIGQDYANQKHALDALHRKTGEDVYVAMFSAADKKGTGEVRSYCVWSEGVDALLPRTDKVFFFRKREGQEEGDVVGAADWERVQQVVGDLMVPVGLYPERYRVREFPGEGQLASLQE